MFKLINISNEILKWLEMTDVFAAVKIIIILATYIYIYQCRIFEMCCLGK